MTREDIIRMAKECGNWSGQTIEMNDVGLERFANLVAAAERVACAQVCEPPTQHNDPLTAWKISLAIRARREK